MTGTCRSQMLHRAYYMRRILGDDHPWVQPYRNDLFYAEALVAAMGMPAHILNPIQKKILTHTQGPRSQCPRCRGHRFHQGSPCRRCKGQGIIY
jgi:hypothetical protein